MIRHLELVARLRAPREEVWRAVTSFDGIAEEMGPWLKMTAPRRVRSLADLDVRPGERLFRSWILLFGRVPIDFSNLTLVSIEEGRGFVEESPMGSMRRWRHARELEDGDAPGTTVLTDTLDFEPRFAAPIVAAIVGRFFAHRHAALARRFGVV